MGPLTETQQETLGRVQTSLKRLARMATAMFELSVGPRASKAPKAERADIREAIEQALHETKPMALNRRIQVNAALAPSGGTLSFDRAQLEQVALNLFENACKFTPKTGCIEIKGYPVFWERRWDTAARSLEGERRRRKSPAPNAYRVDVSNSGPAIPQDRLDRIFEEYVTYSHGEAAAGSGLGLAICKLIVQRHNGKIWAENREGGPTLSFVLPFESGAASPKVGKDRTARAYQTKGAAS
jgi:two-component system sensor histidine kinase KdpD